MRLAFLLLLLISPAASRQDAVPKPEPDEIVFAPRAAVAGMRLVTATSTLRFEGLPDRPHRLVATYLFPDRARWSLRAIGEEKERGSRLLRFRAGERCFALPPGELQSLELVEADLHEALLQMELRRAALLWPDGFEWQVDGDARVAKVTGHGSLRAEFQDSAPEGARPIRFASTYDDGSPCERFEAVRWREGERWPAGFELWLGERRIWTEELTEVVHRGDFLDCFFVPPDRREQAAARLGHAELHHFDLPQRAVRRQVVDPPSRELGEAREAAGVAAEVWRRELEAAGDRSEVEVGLELDAEGRVTALLARIDAPTEVPAAWRAELVEDGPALFRSLAGPEAFDRALLRELRESRPVGARSGAFELRWDSAGGARVLMPLLPADR
jgi:hypothetical protein